jgi:hypothetical protein
VKDCQENYLKRFSRIPNNSIRLDASDHDLTEEEKGGKKMKREREKVRFAHPEYRNTSKA